MNSGDGFWDFEDASHDEIDRDIGQQAAQEDQYLGLPCDHIPCGRPARRHGAQDDLCDIVGGGASRCPIA